MISLFLKILDFLICSFITELLDFSSVTNIKQNKVHVVAHRHLSVQLPQFYLCEFSSAFLFSSSDFIINQAN